MGILDRLNKKKPSTRMYSGAKSSRLTEGFNTSDSSADNELSTSLTQLRARSRTLVRDAPFAKRAKAIVQSNVIGTGIGIQAQVKSVRGKLNKRINSDIEASWKRWTRANNCHTGASLHFSDIERIAMGQVFEAGEIFIRKHYQTFGNSKVPFTLELIEAERLASDIAVPGPLAQGATVRMGVEVDIYQRPIAYWIRQNHPGETRFNQYTDRFERVPADQIIHLRVIDRWPQTRGEPWLHSTLRKLNDVDGYSEAEIIAARSAASYMGIIETPDEYGTPVEDSAIGRETTLEPGLIERLSPGEKFNAFAPNRPNSGAEPFLRFMLREVAAGIGVSYESLSRDYSQSNYSSSRLALLDDRDLWRILQMWFIRSFREPLHSEWLQQSILSRDIPSVSIDAYASDPEKFDQARYKPRGWTWIDPTKEVKAYKEAVLAGFTTVSDVIALTGAGRDIEDVLDERRTELDLMAEKDLVFDTDPQTLNPEPEEPEETEQQDPPEQRVFAFKS